MSPGEAGRVAPDGIDATTPRTGEAVPTCGAASTAEAGGPRFADEDKATPRRLGGPDAGASHPTPRLPASGRREGTADPLSSNRARLRTDGQPGTVPVPERGGSGGWHGGSHPARTGRWLRAVDARHTADDTDPAVTPPPTGHESATRPTADHQPDSTPTSGHPRRPTDGHEHPGRPTDRHAPSSRLAGGRELSSRPTTGYEPAGRPSVRYRPGGRVVAGDGLWPGGGVPAGVEPTTDDKWTTVGERGTGVERLTGVERAAGGGTLWPDLDPSGCSDRRWRVDGPWPRLPDDAPLWSVPDASGDDGAHRRRLDREQAGD
ncbi:hypothetical protein AB0M35_11080 [Micromonospora sp. NPDC051196]|uniref:hypothetical protein n=1 Tax=Micromonospora sp. NPDC051196 TaxID=3155281 RepID=UPI003442CCCD